jgi:hypothetical protein
MFANKVMAAQKALLMSILQSQELKELQKKTEKNI